jgi:hypothetical protein
MPMSRNSERIDNDKILIIIILQCVICIVHSCGDEMQQMLCIVLARIIYITILENVRSNGNCELYIFEAFWPWPSYGYPFQDFFEIEKGIFSQ